MAIEVLHSNKMTKFVRVSNIYWSRTTKWILFRCVKVPNFQNPELKKLKSQNLQSTYKILNGQ